MARTCRTVLAFVFVVGLLAEPRQVSIPMRDGVPLAADVYGADDRVPKPVLLARTPYDKGSLNETALRYAQHGYAVVIQDCRGRYASGGSYTPYNNDRQDGFDTIEWINRQPWSNGRVAMFGSSHLGLVQWLAMAEEPPGLVVIAPAFTASSQYRVAYRRGALRLALIGSGGTRASPPPDARKLPTEIGLLHYHLPLMHLPLARLEEAYGWSLPWMTSLLSHPQFGGFWNQTSAEQEIATSRVPVQIITGYFDFFHHEAMQDYYRLRQRASKAPVQLILGPWTHGSAAKRRTQDVDFGPDSVLDVQQANLAWFESFLKAKNVTGPDVRYFVMGVNKWRTAGAWPPEGTRKEKLYLRADRSAGFDEPDSDEAPSTFISDPANPVPSAPPSRRDIDRSALWSPLDYSAISKRADVLSFTTKPLTKSMTIAGPLNAELSVEADTPDADWVVRVFAVPPQGVALPIAHGIGRASFTESDQRATPIIPGKRFRLTVDLGSSAAALLAGYRIRIEVAGSSFPMYDRNTHTAEGPFSKRTTISHQKVHHARAEASSVVFHVLEP